jgi:uncharacterized protein (TIGR00369 family)
MSVANSALARRILAAPFNRWLDPTVEALERSPVTLTLGLRARPELLRARDDAVFHGGVLAALADIAGDYAALLALDADAALADSEHALGVPTVHLALDFLKPCAGAQIFALASVRRRGRTLVWVDVDLLDAQRQRCAQARGSYLAQIG